MKEELAEHIRDIFTNLFVDEIILDIERNTTDEAHEISVTILIDQNGLSGITSMDER